jgi:hypothetical protein
MNTFVAIFSAMVNSSKGPFGVGNVAGLIHFAPLEIFWRTTNIWDRKVNLCRREDVLWDIVLKKSSRRNQCCVYYSRDEFIYSRACWGLWRDVLLLSPYRVTMLRNASLAFKSPRSLSDIEKFAPNRALMSICWPSSLNSSTLWCSCDRRVYIL